MKGQGAVEYLIILAVVILIALVIVSVLYSLGIFKFRNKVETNSNDISNLLEDVSLSHTINKEGYTQIALRSVTDQKVTIYNFTIGGCLFEFNSTTLTTSWQVFKKSCPGVLGKAGDMYDLKCTLTYNDSLGITHSTSGRCKGFYEE